MDPLQTGFLPLLAAVAPVFLILGLGYGMRRIGWLTEEADSSLMRVIVNLLYPCLILDTILGNRAFDNPQNLFLAPLSGFFTVCLGYAVSWWAAPCFGIHQPAMRRTFAFATGLYNYGYVPLPLIQKFFDPETTAVLFIHNVGVETALWTAGLFLLRGPDQPGTGALWRRILNVPLLAIAAALTLHFLNARVWLPPFATQAVHSLGAAAIPMGLLLTGATFADQMGSLSSERPWSTDSGSILLRLGLLPALMLLVARWAPCPVELRRVMLVQAAMPCAVIPVLLSRHYGGQPGLAMRIVLATSALGFFTIPFWLQKGAEWIPGIAR
jgi:predicted permease